MRRLVKRAKLRLRHLQCVSILCSLFFVLCLYAQPCQWCTTLNQMALLCAFGNLLLRSGAFASDHCRCPRICRVEVYANLSANHWSICTKVCVFVDCNRCASADTTTASIGISVGVVIVLDFVVRWNVSFHGVDLWHWRIHHCGFRWLCPPKVEKCFCDVVYLLLWVVVAWAWWHMCVVSGCLDVRSCGNGNGNGYAIAVGIDPTLDDSGRCTEGVKQLPAAAAELHASASVEPPQEKRPRRGPTEPPTEEGSR